MARVEWTRTAPDDVEAVIAIMLCRENPAATRRKPSRGDGGVDVYIPTDAGLVVYQVKSLTGRLTGGHKRQITESWNAFRGLISDTQDRVAAWHLIRPEDPTQEDEQWLAALTAECGFPCSWRGLAYCDSLAATYPEVIDYYLRDGKERLDYVVREYLELAGFADKGPDMPSLEASLSTGALSKAHEALNRFDPHYWYDFAVEKIRDGILPPIGEARPNLVAAAQRGDGERAITYRIYARCGESVAERPVPGSFTIEVEPGSEDDKAVRDFFEYGIPIEKLAVRDLSVDLPGGLGGKGQEGFITLGPARRTDAPPPDLQIRIVTPEHVQLAKVDLVMEPATAGLSGEKFAVSGRERHGVFDATLRFDPEARRMNLSVHSNDLTGLLPADVIGGLRVLAAFGPPHFAVLSMRNGPDFGEPIPIPTELVGTDDLPALIELMEALATIQRHTVNSIRVPDLTTVTNDDALQWLHAARLLRGDAIPFRWTEMLARRPPGGDLPNAGEPLVIWERLPLTIKFGNEELELGVEEFVMTGAIVDGGYEHPDDPDAVRFIPSTDAPGVVRMFKGDLPEEPPSIAPPP